MGFFLNFLGGAAQGAQNRLDIIDKQKFREKEKKEDRKFQEEQNRLNRQNQMDVAKLRIAGDVAKATRTQAEELKTHVDTFKNLYGGFSEDAYYAAAKSFAGGSITREGVLGALSSYSVEKGDEALPEATAQTITTAEVDQLAQVSPDLGKQLWAQLYQPDAEEVPVSAPVQSSTAITNTAIPADRPWLSNYIEEIESAGLSEPQTKAALAELDEVRDKKTAMQIVEKWSSAEATKESDVAKVTYTGASLRKQLVGDMDFARIGGATQDAALQAQSFANHFADDVSSLPEFVATRNDALLYGNRGGLDYAAQAAKADAAGLDLYRIGFTGDPANAEEATKRLRDLENYALSDSSRFVGPRTFAALDAAHRDVVPGWNQTANAFLIPDARIKNSYVSVLRKSRELAVTPEQAASLDTFAASFADLTVADQENRLISRIADNTLATSQKGTARDILVSATTRVEDLLGLPSEEAEKRVRSMLPAAMLDEIDNPPSDNSSTGGDTGDNPPSDNPPTGGDTGDAPSTGTPEAPSATPLQDLQERFNKSRNAGQTVDDTGNFLEALSDVEETGAVDTPEYARTGLGRMVSNAQLNRTKNAWADMSDKERETLLEAATDEEREKIMQLTQKTKDDMWAELRPSTGFGFIKETEMRKFKEREYYDNLKADEGWTKAEDAKTEIARGFDISTPQNRKNLKEVMLSVDIDENLADRYIAAKKEMSEEDADKVFKVFADKAAEQASDLAPEADPLAQQVLANLIYNMGYEGVTKKFPSFVKAMQEGDYTEASLQLMYGDTVHYKLNPYVKQTKNRAARNILLLRELGEQQQD